MYAIVDIKSKQFKVSEGDTLYVPYQKDLDPGTEITYDDVLLVSDDGDVQVGEPRVGGASVQARVLDHVKDDKVTVFKFKKRNRYRIKRGHRQPYTQIEIEDLTVGEAPEAPVREPEEEIATEPEVSEEEPEETTGEEPSAEEEVSEPAEDADSAPDTEEEETEKVEALELEEIEDLVDRAVEADVLERAGSWYKYEGETLGQGKSAAAEWLAERPDVLAEIQEGLNE